MGIKKAELYADLEFFEKVAKNLCEKSYRRKIDGKHFQPITFLGKFC